MTHSFHEADWYVGQMLQAHHEGRKEDYERLYFEALSTSDPQRPMFLIVNLLCNAIVEDARMHAQADDDSAAVLIREALEGIPDPWKADTHE